jgi:uncharacterized protein YecE (DUF72 family)
LRLGTCSWSTTDWVGTIYSPDTRPVDFISEYAKRFSTVEIDSTFYGTPRTSTIEGWRDRTPMDFLFAAKAPQIITHEKFLANCERDLSEFLDAMSILGPRLGPIVFQFPYYSKQKNVTERDFLNRLAPFLETLPKDRFTFIVEVRNRGWIKRDLLELLRGHNAALALIDHPWMARPAQLFSIDGIATGPCLYIRWLGDRYGIEKITKTWGAHVLDRRPSLQEWVPGIQRALARGQRVFGYINSHYSGYAPGDVGILLELLGLT